MSSVSFVIMIAEMDDEKGNRAPVPGGAGINVYALYKQVCTASTCGWSGARTRAAS